MQQSAEQRDHLQVVCEPHRDLPVMVWMGSTLLAQLPSREALRDLDRHHVLQRLRHRLLMERQTSLEAGSPPA